MDDADKTREQLTQELVLLRRKLSESENGADRTEFEEMRALLENTLIGLAVTTSHGIQKINGRGASMFGYAPRELIGRGIDLLHFSPEDFQRFDREAGQALARDGRFCSEGRMRRKDGSAVWARLYANAIRPGDRDAGVVWAFDDIGPHKALEEELRRSKEEAEKANQAKSAFLANMSHEMRTPINGVIGMLQLVMETKPTSEQAELLEMSMQSAQTLMHVVNDLLEMSAIQAGRLVIASREFDPRTEFEPLLRNFVTQSQLKNFTFSYSIAPDVPRALVGDPNRTKQILVNLVGNAFKFTRRGSVSVSIGQKPAEDAGQAPALPALSPDRIRTFFSVRDTGVGVDPARKADIFAPFGIGEEALTKKYSGAGMGLSICRQLADMMHGAVWFISEPGRGSVFTFVLEYGLPAEARPASPEGDRCEPAVAESEGPGLRILLAEDEPVNRIFTVRALQKLGHSVETANDGRQALERLAKGSYDLILMDIQMPRLNGLEATRLIRSGQVKGAAPDIPIVALTAYAMESDRAKGQEAGMDEYVSKPFEIVDLMEAVDRVMLTSASQRQGLGKG